MGAAASRKANQMEMAPAQSPRSEFKRFLFTYRYNGTDWSIEIPALSAEEAKERVKVLPFAVCHGEIRPRSAAPTRTPRPTRIASWFRQAG